MTLLWSFMASTKAMEDHLRVTTGKKPAFNWVNRMDWHDYVDAQLGGRDEQGRFPVRITGLDLSGAPTPRWLCSDPSFAPNLIHEGELFVSARLADALALDPSAAQYLPVDCSACPPAMRAMGYQVLNLLTYANPLDRERTSPAEFEDVALPDGGSTFIWTAEPPGPGGEHVPRVAWRDDFIAPAPLFMVPGFGHFATDELAERVMRAGFSDVMFLDETNDGTRTTAPAERLLA